MIVDGKWVENATCRSCRFRHPPGLTCEQARLIAKRDRGEKTDNLITLDLAQTVAGWVRVRPDGSLTEEYLPDRLVEKARRNSGAWMPLRPETAARPKSEYHEDMGPVLWWRFPDGSDEPLGEPAWIGRPSDEEWPPDYYTHFTPHPAPPVRYD